MGSLCECFTNSTNSPQTAEKDETPEYTPISKPIYQTLSKELPNVVKNNIESEQSVTAATSNSDLLEFGANEACEGYEPIIDYWFRISCSSISQHSTNFLSFLEKKQKMLQIPLDITQLIIHYTQFFEFQSNHPLINVSSNGLIATHDSGMGDGTIMFGRPFPFLSTHSTKSMKVLDQFRTKYKLEIKINDCGCRDNIGIAFVPQTFNHLKGSPYKYKETYIVYSDGVYHDWNQKCKHTRNSFTFNENGTVLRIIIDSLNGKIIIVNKNKNDKKHIINIHPKYGGRQQMRFAFVMYSGGKPENSKIEILSQAWQNQPLTPSTFNCSKNPN